MNKFIAVVLFGFGVLMSIGSLSNLLGEEIRVSQTVNLNPALFSFLITKDECLPVEYKNRVLVQDRIKSEEYKISGVPVDRINGTITVVTITGMVDGKTREKDLVFTTSKEICEDLRIKYKGKI